MSKLCKMRFKTGSWRKAHSRGPLSQSCKHWVTIFIIELGNLSERSEKKILSWDYYLIDNWLTINLRTFLRSSMTLVFLEVLIIFCSSPLMKTSREVVESSDMLCQLCHLNPNHKNWKHDKGQICISFNKRNAQLLPYYEILHCTKHHYFKVIP